ncbi:MAG: NAD-dependent epimerase/dehydratase family protein [Aeromicrobium sp.]
MGDPAPPGPVLVTGGSGFIGTNVVQALVDAGRAVVNIDVAPPRNPQHRDLWTRVDLVDAAAVRAAVEATAPASVLHLGARTDLEGETVDDYAANTTGTANVLAALSACPVPPRVIVASSRMVLPIGVQPSSDVDFDPPNAYGMSKVETERITRASHYPGTWAITRPTSIWGPWFKEPYRDFFMAVAKGQYRHPGHAQVRKSFGYVENTVAQLLALLEAPAEAIQGRVFYLADYEPIDVLEWGGEIRRATGTGSSVKTIPLGALRAAARTGDVLKRLGWANVPLTTFRLGNLLTEMIYDLRPMEELLPALPVPASEGVLRTVAWLRATGDLPDPATGP